MSSANQNLSHTSHLITDVPGLANKRIVLLRSLWNAEVTDALLAGARNLLLEAGLPAKGLQVLEVPGSFELVFAAAKAMQTGCDGIIALGCVVRGETPHFEYICQGIAQGIAALNTRAEVPVIFGLLTTENQQQALERAGGRYGNKGEEAAATLLHMMALSYSSRP